MPDNTTTTSTPSSNAGTGNSSTSAQTTAPTVATIEATPGTDPISAGDAYWTSSPDVRQRLVNLLCGAAYFGDNELVQRLVLEEKVDMQACGKVTSLRNVDDARGACAIGIVDSGLCVSVINLGDSRRAHEKLDLFLFSHVLTPFLFRSRHLLGR